MFIASLIKFSIFIVATTGLTSLSTARADSLNGCYWHDLPHQNNTLTREFSILTPSNIKLNLVKIGQVMASSKIQLSPKTYSVLCSDVTTPYFNVFYDIINNGRMELESGYADVYSTNIKGVGIRLRSDYYGRYPFSIPGGHSQKNAGLNHSSTLMEHINYEFIRTAVGVGSGSLNLNFKIRHQVSGWLASNLTASGIVNVEVGGYFAGCSGVTKDILVPMGKLWAGDLLSSARTETFKLDVRCTGLPAGTKLPVKVYFEGDSPGEGRLNLLGGGATGVEILLRSGSGSGYPLPISMNRPVSLSWLRTDPEGEIYTLPISARYAKKANTNVQPGRADAVLTYITEYN